MILVDRSQAFDWFDWRPESVRQGDTGSVSGRLRVDRPGTGLTWCACCRLLGRRRGITGRGGRRRSSRHFGRLVRRCRHGDGRFGRCVGRRCRRLGGWLCRFDGRIRGPEVAIALRTLPELLGGPRIFRSRVRQVHLGTAPLTTNADIGVVHGETDCSVQPQRFATRPPGGGLRCAALLLGHRYPICSLVAAGPPGAAPGSRAGDPLRRSTRSAPPIRNPGWGTPPLGTST